MTAKEEERGDARANLGSQMICEWRVESVGVVMLGSCVCVLCGRAAAVVEFGG